MRQSLSLEVLKLLPDPNQKMSSANFLKQLFTCFKQVVTFKFSYKSFNFFWLIVARSVLVFFTKNSSNVSSFEYIPVHMKTPLSMLLQDEKMITYYVLISYRNMADKTPVRNQALLNVLWTVGIAYSCE